MRRVLRAAVRASVRRRSPSRRRSRGSVEERPLHTRKVAGSIPAGTTSISAVSGLRCITRHNPWAGLRPFHAANMRPSRGLAARRKIARHVAPKNLPQAAFQTSACPGDDCSGLRANHIATAENTVVRPLPNFGQIEVSALSVADSPGQSRRRRDFPPLEVAERVERHGDVVQLVVKEVGLSVRGDGNGGVAYSFLQQTKVRTGPPRQPGVGMSQIVNT
jgi:hypothetical protein